MVVLRMRAATVTIKGHLIPIRWRFARLEGKGEHARQTSADWPANEGKAFVIHRRSGEVRMLIRGQIQ